MHIDVTGPMLTQCAREYCNSSLPSAVLRRVMLGIEEAITYDGFSLEDRRVMRVTVERLRQFVADLRADEVANYCDPEPSGDEDTGGA